MRLGQALFLTISTCFLGSLPSFAETRPNIIVILSDDMGWSDVGCYGGEISTPNLDQLAAGGLRYTRFYNAGRCCPTRASLLTGLYPHQAGIGRMTSDGKQPGYRGDLSRQAVTLAELLKSAGYRTYLSGKWHVSKNVQPAGDKSNWPLQRGFDEFYGTIIGAGSFYDPWTAWEARCMEVYAAMIDSMDQGVGRLIDALKTNGQFDNTLIPYLQGNGGCWEGYGRQPRPNPASGVEAMAKGELQTEMFPLRTRSGHPVLMGPAVMPGPDTSFIAYGRNWANVSNTPFRRYKSEMHEGGIATPLIVHWPKGITARNGLRHEPGHLIDIMPTCVELAKAAHPVKSSGHDITPMEGRSLVPGFAKDRNDERLLIWEHYRNAALVKGDWKMVRLGENTPGKDMENGWELYNVREDRSELHNLAESHPEKAAELVALWHKHARRTLVFPMPDDKR